MRKTQSLKGELKGKGMVKLDSRGDRHSTPRIRRRRDGRGPEDHTREKKAGVRGKSENRGQEGREGGRVPEHRTLHPRGCRPPVGTRKSQANKTKGGILGGFQ